MGAVPVVHQELRFLFAQLGHDFTQSNSCTLLANLEHVLVNPTGKFRPLAALVWAMLFSAVPPMIPAALHQPWETSTEHHILQWSLSP